MPESPAFTEPPDGQRDEMSTPTVEILDVTPAVAEAWLAKNPNNRNVRWPLVEAYARDITDGNWALNGESVKLTADGRLIDGQHRLSAVVEAGATVPMVVVRGLPIEVMDTIDTGAKRAFADALRIAGEPNPSTLAAVARKALLWDRGLRLNTGTLRVTTRELADHLEAHPRLRRSADLASKLSSRERLPASTTGLCHYLFSDLDPDAATSFMLRVADGDGIAATDPIAVLRSRVVRLRLAGGRINEAEGLALMIRAWNAHRDGETRTKLAMPRGGLTNENFPEPR